MTKKLDHRHESVPANYYDYAIEHNIFQRYWHEQRFKQVGDLLSTFTAQKILDVGCHDGRFTAEIARRFPNATIYGIDISTEAINFAKKQYPRFHFLTARAEQLPFSSNQFDLVVCFELLEHVEDPKIVVNEIWRVLTKKGSTVMLVPTENLLFRMIWFFWIRFGPGRVWQHTHIQKFQNHKLDDILTELKLQVVERKLFLFGMLLLMHAKKKG